MTVTFIIGDEVREYTNVGSVESDGNTVGFYTASGNLIDCICANTTFSIS